MLQLPVHRDCTSDPYACRLQASGLVPVSQLTGSGTGAEVDLRLSDTMVVRFSNNADFGRLFAPGLYLQPAAQNYPSVDGVYIGPDDRRPLLLQCTVAGQHPISDRLTELLEVFAPRLQATVHVRGAKSLVSTVEQATNVCCWAQLPPELNVATDTGDVGSDGAVRYDVTVKAVTRHTTHHNRALAPSCML